MGWVFTDETRFYLHENETLLDGMIRTEHKRYTTNADRVIVVLVA